MSGNHNHRHLPTVGGVPDLGALRHPDPGESPVGGEVLPDDAPRDPRQEALPWVVVEWYKNPVTGELGTMVCGPFPGQDEADDYARWHAAHPSELLIRIHSLQLSIDPRVLLAEHEATLDADDGPVGSESFPPGSELDTHDRDTR